MSAVNDLCRALNAAGIDCEWEGLGGGVYGVMIDHPEGEILVSDRDDCFLWRDMKTDEYVSGFMAAVRHMPEEFRQYDGTGRQVYKTSEDAGYAAYERDERDENVRVTDLPAEILACVAAIKAELDHANSPAGQYCRAVMEAAEGNA